MAIAFLRKMAFRQKALDLFLIVCIFFSSIKLTYRIEDIVDIILSDESYYLANGVNLIKQGLPVAEWAPLYAVWYWFLSLIQFNQDNISLYYFNQKLLVALTAILLYISLRSLGCNRMIAAATSFAYLISSIPVIWPRPNHFALLLILLFIAMQKYLRAETNFYYVLSLTLLFVSYVRPEYFLSFLMTSILVGVLDIKAIFFALPSQRKYSYLRLSLYAVFSLFLVALLGIPTSSGDRSWWAFASHFALRWTWQNPTDLDPWVDYQSIAASAFGNAQTIFEAMQANPPAFAKHLFENMKGYFENTLSILEGSLKDYSPSLNDLSPKINSMIRLGELIVFLLACIQIIRRYCINTEPSQSKTFIRLLMITFFVELSVIPASLIIFPRYHYLIIHVVLLFVLLAFLLSTTLKSKVWNMGLKQIFITGCLLLLLTPTLSRGWCISNTCAFRRQHIPPRPNLETIHFIRSLNINATVNLLAFDIEYKTFLGGHYHRINPADKKINFIDFMEQNKINMIILSAEIKQDIRLVADQEWQAFLQNHQNFDYQKLDIPNTARILLIHRNLLTSHSLSSLIRVPLA